MVEEKVLNDLGLTSIEAKVYLACLELGQATVLNIAKKAEIKRPTAYVALDNLIEKGFITKLAKKSTTLFSAQDPKLILNSFKEKINNFTELLPYFEAKLSKGPKPKIRFYEGHDELFKVYTQIIFKSQEIYFFGTDVGKLIGKMPTILNYWKKDVADKKKKGMEIISLNQAGILYVKENKSRPIKFMSKDLPVFADVAITENKLFIVSLDNMFGVLIESEDLAQTFKNFFLLAWKSAEQV